MIPIVLASLALLVALGVFATTYAQGLNQLIKRRVVVQTKDDRSLQGVLLSTFRDSLLIGAPRYLEEANPADIPGEVLVPRANVSWVQVLPAED